MGRICLYTARIGTGMYASALVVYSVDGNRVAGFWPLLVAVVLAAAWVVGLVDQMFSKYSKAWSAVLGGGETATDRKVTNLRRS